MTEILISVELVDNVADVKKAAFLQIYRSENNTLDKLTEKRPVLNASLLYIFFQPENCFGVSGYSVTGYGFLCGEGDVGVAAEVLA